jgi:hypothetical protein
MAMASGEDAQRELEQRALRNVRGLVDRMETEETLSRRTQLKLVVGLVVLVLVGLVAVVMVARQHESRAVDIPLKPGQVMPQAPRAPQ